MPILSPDTYSPTRKADSNKRVWLAPVCDTVLLRSRSRAVYAAASCLVDLKCVLHHELPEEETASRCTE